MADHQIIKPRRNWEANRVPLSTDLVDNEIALNLTDRILYVKNPATGNIVSITLGGSGGGSANIVEATTAAGFPATGSAGTLYHATNTSRIYFWDSSGAYVEAGTSGGGGSGSSALTAATSSELGGIKVGSGLTITDGVLSAAGDTVLRALFAPGAPTSVTALGRDTFATVSWTAPTGVISQAPITDYVVQFSSNSGSTWTTFADGTSTATSATVTGLTNGTAYTFRVAAVNGVGQGAWSTASSAVTPIAGDAYWDNVTLLIHGDGSITDSSKYARSLTISGASVSSTAKFGSGSVSARGGNMVQYFNDWTAFGTGDFTIEAWIYHMSSANAPNSYAHMLFSNGPGGTYYGINWGATFEIQLIGPSSSGMADVRLCGEGFGGFSMNADQWYHLALCRDGGYVRCFINGSPIGSVVASALTTNFNGTNLFIGDNYRGNGSENRSILMDEIRITAASRYGLTNSFTPPTAAFLNS